MKVYERSSSLSLDGTVSGPNSLTTNKKSPKGVNLFGRYEVSGFEEH